MYSYLPFLIALLVSFTSAQSNFTAISGTGPGGPIQNASYFEEYNQSPNATGTGYLSGANTSYSDPRRLQSATWDTRINVTEVPWTNNQTVTNTVISLSTSDNVFASNSSWETCVVLLTNVPRNVTVEGQDDKGNYITSNQTDGSAWMFQSSDAHDPTNFTFYEEAVTRIWPMMLIQGPSNDFVGGGFTIAQMSCLRATNITSGSRKVDSVPGAASRVMFDGWVTLVALGTLALLL
ncbi:hypothetical protein EYC84_005007 [Monilinia fructicola]|uniref:Uncharacterized protein n=1 Tax=Monilinia fructicola TaxID=38448 RepID=A0A5M9JW58_MONFR|nr:hypothetical protein EYC84_005007 [Monilinia fructicola]